MKKYDPKDIEPKWQEIWEKSGIYHAVDFDKSRKKYYLLVEFPYPSGDGLHAGHVRSYTALDVMARQKRMAGFNVLYPMGFDEFGLPTENYAIKNKIAPQIATEQNVKTFKRQMQSLGLSFDWSREVRTSDPAYYRWTQWIFLQLYKDGLAYQAEIPINWCPFEKTGLANEEVVNGRHERCGTLVEKKLLKQWLLKITDYADRLLSDLGTVDYLDRIATQQVNWIGRSEGAEITFEVAGEKVTVFTTRADTLAGATFMVLAPEHPLVGKVTTKDQKAAVEKYLKQVEHETEPEREEMAKPKTGVFTGAHATNPITGEKMPVWVSDYVLMEYGTGAIMAVPAHDERDGEFAVKFDLPIRQVILPHLIDHENPPKAGKENTTREIIHALVKHPTEDKYVALRHKKQPWLTPITGGIEPGEDAVKAAEREIKEETGYQNFHLVKQMPLAMFAEFYAAHKDVNRAVKSQVLEFQLDNLEQKNLATEEAENHELVWVDGNKIDQLQPVSEIDFIVDWLKNGGKPYTGEGRLMDSGKYDGLESVEAKQKIVKDLEKQGLAEPKVRYKLRDWIFSRQHYWGEPIPIVHCPKCGIVPVPEADLPVELPKVDHYEPTDTGESPLANITDWVNVKCPKCGGEAKRETDTMPNWAGSSWYFLRYADPKNDQAFADPRKLEYWTPVDLYNGGMEHTTLHLLYSRFWHKFLYDKKFVPTPEPYAARRSHGMILAADGKKMSKSLGNVVNPDSVVEKYGADALRLYEMFMGPFDQEIAWSDERVAGVYRFINRVWQLAMRLNDPADNKPNKVIESSIFQTEVDRMLHKAIKKITDDISSMHFNTMVSALMELTNFLSEPTRLASFGVSDNQELARRTAATLVLLIAPVAPYVAEELWAVLGQTESVHLHPWPAYDEAMLKDELVEVVVQVNGKLRATLTLPADYKEDELAKLAGDQAAVKQAIGSGKITKTIHVPHRLINFVTR